MKLMRLARACSQLPAPPRLSHLDLVPFKYNYEKSMFYENYTLE
jgi:hypothetical protein